MGDYRIIIENISARPSWGEEKYNHDMTWSTEIDGKKERKTFSFRFCAAGRNLEAISSRTPMILARTEARDRVAHAFRCTDQLRGHATARRGHEWETFVRTTRDGARVAAGSDWSSAGWRRGSIDEWADAPRSTYLDSAYGWLGRRGGPTGTRLPGRDDSFPPPAASYLSFSLSLFGARARSSSVHLVRTHARIPSRSVLSATSSNLYFRLDRELGANWSRRARDRPGFLTVLTAKLLTASWLPPSPTSSSSSCIVVHRSDVCAPGQHSPSWRDDACLNLNTLR